MTQPPAPPSLWPVACVKSLWSSLLSDGWRGLLALGGRQDLLHGAPRPQLPVGPLPSRDLSLRARDRRDADTSAWHSVCSRGGPGCRPADYPRLVLRMPSGEGHSGCFRSPPREPRCARAGPRRHVRRSKAPAKGPHTVHRPSLPLPQSRENFSSRAGGGRRAAGPPGTVLYPASLAWPFLRPTNWKRYRAQLDMTAVKAPSFRSRHQRYRCCWGVAPASLRRREKKSPRYFHGTVSKWQKTDPCDLPLEPATTSPRSLPTDKSSLPRLCSDCVCFFPLSASGLRILASCTNVIAVQKKKACSWDWERMSSAGGSGWKEPRRGRWERKEQCS